MNEPIKFNKILILNDFSPKGILWATQKLFFCMDETNTHEKLYLVSFQLIFRDSIVSMGSKDLILEWSCNKEQDTIAWAPFKDLGAL